MDKYIIRGGNSLHGSVKVSGAKNAALALMPAALLNRGKNTIYNAPEVNDIYTMMKLLKSLGAEVSFNTHQLTIDTSGINNQLAPYEHVKKMRASVYVLGPLLARYGFARVSLPGGCAWGPRPINLHLEGLRKLGAEIRLEGGYIIAKAERLKGTKISFDISSVGATGNIMMAAVLAEGTTLINNASSEPEITLLAEFLVKMGARIEGIGTSQLEIQGVDELSPSEIKNIPDRIEAGTLLTAAAITRGSIRLEEVIPGHLSTELSCFEKSGAVIGSSDDSITLDYSGVQYINPVDVMTEVYPGFPTDMQAQWIAFMCRASSTTTVTDSIYPDRFNHVPELIRLGADIEVRGNSAIIHPIEKFIGAKVMSTDLRASACLVLAGLAAEGETEVLRIYHLDRGYEQLESKLRILGADMERIPGAEY